MPQDPNDIVMAVAEEKASMQAEKEMSSPHNY
jgi:hypothetical protein